LALKHGANYNLQHHVYLLKTVANKCTTKQGLQLSSWFSFDVIFYLQQNYHYSSILCDPGAVSVRRKKWCHKKLHKSLQGLFTYHCQLFLAPWLTTPVSLRLLHPRHMRETWAWVEFQRLNAFIFIFCIQKLSALLCFLDCVFILGKQTL
jgi:hypothetical protein